MTNLVAATDAFVSSKGSKDKRGYGFCDDNNEFYVQYDSNTEEVIKKRIDDVNHQNIKMDFCTGWCRVVRRSLMCDTSENAILVANMALLNFAVETNARVANGEKILYTLPKSFDEMREAIPMFQFSFLFLSGIDGMHMPLSLSEFIKEGKSFYVNDVTTSKFLIQ